MSDNNNNQNDSSQKGGMGTALFVMLWQWLQGVVRAIDSWIDNAVSFISFNMIHIHTPWGIGLFIAIIWGIFLFIVALNLALFMWDMCKLSYRKFVLKEFD